MKKISTASEPVDPIADCYDHESKDSVFPAYGKWYFWDETWAHYHGPYATEAEARTALDRYAETL